MALFQRLQDWQTALGKSDEEVAGLIRISRSKLSRAKRGLQPLPMADQLALEKISGIKPTDWAEFYAGVVASQPQKKNDDRLVEEAV